MAIAGRAVPSARGVGDVERERGVRVVVKKKLYLWSNGISLVLGIIFCFITYGPGGVLIAIMNQIVMGLTLLLGQLSGSSHRVHAGEWGTSSWSREETGDVKDGFGEECICAYQRRGLGRVRLAKPELATPS